MDFSQTAAVFETLRLPPPPRLVLLEALSLSAAHVPPYPPDMPALFTRVEGPNMIQQLRKVMLTTYPQGHMVFWVTPAQAQAIRLVDLDGASLAGTGCLYVPALGEGTSFEAFVEIVAHLRAPDGCPWDKEQTHASLRKHLLEESYEAIAAIDSGDFNAMREEFGDLLLQAVLQSQIANDEKRFNINEVIQGIYAKIVRRHPHVFGEVQVEGVEGVLANWEKLKEAERKNSGQKEKGLLDGVPLALPALSQAQEYQDRAARVGFDWPEVAGVLDKIKEEVEEVRKAETDFELASEVGDLLFALVNLARWKKVDAESVLRGANAKFRKRLAYVEQGAKAQGRNLSELTPAEMDDLWNAAKQKGL